MSIHGNKPLYSDMFSYYNYWLYSFIITWVQISLTIHFENVIRIILKLLSLIIIGSNRFHSSWDCPSLCWRKIFVRSVKLDYSIRWVSKLEWIDSLDDKNHFYSVVFGILFGTILISLLYLKIVLFVLSFVSNLVDSYYWNCEYRWNYSLLFKTISLFCFGSKWVWSIQTSSSSSTIIGSQCRKTI